MRIVLKRRTTGKRLRVPSLVRLASERLRQVNWRWLAVFGLAAVTGFLMWRLWSGRQPVLITFTNSGFEPETVTIQQGQTVKFVNESETDFWPASNLHPSHEIYSEFDPLQAVPAGSTWQFQFERAGRWEFHDHLQPQFTGMISVIGPNQTQLDLCQGNVQQKISCWEDVIIKTLEEDGVDAAFSVVDHLYANQEEFGEGCHQVAHIIGEAAFDLYASDEDFEVSEKSTYCGFGFYHGLMEQLLRETGDLKLAGEFCHYIDDKLRRYTGDAGLQCFHGIGHGTVDSHDGRYFGDAEGMVKPALKLCEDVSQTDQELYRCVSGVYNGIANFYFDTEEYGLIINRDDPFELCHVQPAEYREACYGNLNVTLMWIVENDMSRALEYVQAIPYPEERERAFWYATVASMIPITNQDSYTVEAAFCNQVALEYQQACVTGTAGGLVEHGQPGQEHQNAIQFCQDSGLQPGLRDACWQYLTNYFSGWFGPERLEVICQGLTGEAQTYCIEALDRIRSN